MGKGRRKGRTKEAADSAALWHMWCDGWHGRVATGTRGRGRNHWTQTWTDEDRDMSGGWCITKWEKNASALGMCGKQGRSTGGLARLLLRSRLGWGCAAGVGVLSELGSRALQWKRANLLLCRYGSLCVLVLAGRDFGDPAGSGAPVRPGQVRAEHAPSPLTPLPRHQRGWQAALAATPCCAAAPDAGGVGKRDGGRRVLVGKVAAVLGVGLGAGVGARGTAARQRDTQGS